MDPKNWPQIENLYHRALELPPAERAAYIGLACSGDEELRCEVESLVSSHLAAVAFMEDPVAEQATRLIADEQISSIIGQSVGNYAILSLIDTGGMGEVYLAEDTRLGRQVAVKLLPSCFGVDGERVRRFQQEARAASALNHPNILTIHEVGEANGRQFLATEFIDGITLRQRMGKSRLMLIEALEIGTQIASALAAAHQAHIVHRDVKPENIMIRPDGYVKVVDFGLAKLIEPPVSHADSPTLVSTDPGMVMGTARYMSPEQARGLEADPRTDIWSLGVVLYEMLAERTPFEGETATDIIVSIIEKNPPPLTRYSPGIPVEMAWIVGKALRKDREERYQTAKDLWNDLRRFKQHLDIAHELHASAEPRLGDQAQRSSGTSYRQGAHSHRSPVKKASSPTRTSSGPRRSRSAINSLAVLPLANISPDPNAEYLSDGITDTIIHNLSRLPTLKVMAHAPVFRYKGQEIEPQVIGNALNVLAVMTGRLLQVGDELLITTELVDVRDGSQLGGEQYKRKLADI
ncbi:MAG: protein kinase domain-containing protein, partial [Pyrinomonadaceae bacterium]